MIEGRRSLAGLGVLMLRTSPVQPLLIPCAQQAPPTSRAAWKPANIALQGYKATSALSGATLCYHRLQLAESDYNVDGGERDLGQI